MTTQDIRSGRGLWVAVLILGPLVWLSSLIVDTHPIYAAAAVLAVLVFSAFVLPRPKRSDSLHRLERHRPT
jgi:hypothetical protein